MVRLLCSCSDSVGVGVDSVAQVTQPVYLLAINSPITSTSCTSPGIQYIHMTPRFLDYVCSLDRILELCDLAISCPSAT